MQKKHHQPMQCQRPFNNTVKQADRLFLADGYKTWRAAQRLVTFIVIYHWLPRFFREFTEAILAPSHTHESLMQLKATA